MMGKQCQAGVIGRIPSLQRGIYQVQDAMVWQTLWGAISDNVMLHVVLGLTIADMRLGDGRKVIQDAG